MTAMTQLVAWVLQCYQSAKTGVVKDISKARQEAAMDIHHFPQLKDAVGSDAMADMQYAVCALIDEWMFEQKINTWQQYPLQVEFFNDYTAGEGFFERLDNFKKFPDLNRLPLLTYYACLQLGFKGKYLDNNAASLSKLKRELSALLLPSVTKPKLSKPNTRKREKPRLKKQLFILVSSMMLLWGSCKLISIYQGTQLDNDLHVIYLIDNEKSYFDPGSSGQARGWRG